MLAYGTHFYGLNGQRRGEVLKACYFCQKSAQPDGSIFHHPNCAGLEQSEFSNLQVHRLETRVHELEAELQGWRNGCTGKNGSQSPCYVSDAEVKHAAD
jgi:hypothetical protein